MFSPTLPLFRALRRLALTTKRARKGYYKGKPDRLDGVAYQARRLQARFLEGQDVCCAGGVGQLQCRVSSRVIWVGGGLLTGLGIAYAVRCEADRGTEGPGDEGTELSG